MRRHPLLSFDAGLGRVVGGFEIGVLLCLQQRAVLLTVGGVVQPLFLDALRHSLVLPAAEPRTAATAIDRCANRSRTIDGAGRLIVGLSATWADDLHSLKNPINSLQLQIVI